MQGDEIVGRKMLRAALIVILSGAAATLSIRDLFTRAELQEADA